MTVQPAYTILMSLELGSIGIMYQVTTMADMNLPSTMVIFHFSGVVGCETLLWILLPQLWNWYIIINLFLLLVTSFCFFNCIHNTIITKLTLLRSNHVLPPNLELQESQV
ncbi:hypothetical protein QL285_012191 [Trifolium repens]|nr:hypothetical protein QL285_012191 [Trifolium repens]